MPDVLQEVRDRGRLSDSYRYAYLALESILSDIRPPRANEGEGEWLVDALREATKLASLSPDFSVGGRDPVEAAKEEWYNRERLRLFHSKSARPVSAVLTERDFERLLKKKHDLLSFFISLCRVQLNLRRGGGGMTNHTIESILSEWDCRELRFELFDDSNPAISGGEVAGFRELHSPVPSDRGAFYARRVTLPPSRRVLSFNMTSDIGLMVWNVLDAGALEVGEHDELGVRLATIFCSADFKYDFES
jgi:hypothetical protein